MNKFSVFLDRLWERGVPVSLVAVTLLLATIAIIVTGSGLHSAFIWLILAGVTILSVALCSCFKFKKSVSRWRRTSVQSDTTVMDGNDFSSIEYPTRGSISLSGDLPPTYSAATFPERLPPPPYTVVALSMTTFHTSDREEIFMPPSYSSIVSDPDTSVYQQEDMTIPPPPYNSIGTNVITAVRDETTVQQPRIQISTGELDNGSISIISSVSVSRGNKNICEGNKITSQD